MGNIKEFFKPNLEKVILSILLLFLEGFMLFNLMSVGLSNTYVPIAVVLGFPLIFFMYDGGMGLLIGFVLELFLLYVVSCILIKIIVFLENKLLLINWDAKKFIALGVILIIGLLVYGFFNFGWGDVFIPTADDNGATIQGVTEIVKANNHFAIDLYSKISKNSTENIFFSPFSISNGMVLAYEGARGKTATEIQKVFYFPTDDNLRRSSYAKMLNTLNKGGGKYKLSIANAIWLQKDYSFLKNYKNTISNYYLGEIKNVNFINNPEGASDDINNWVSRNTNYNIKNIVSPDLFDGMTRAVLTNAIYFKGKWEHQFDKSDTKPEDFTLPSGQKIKVPMMRLEDMDLEFNYAESDGIQILEMPYQGDKLSMLVLLPEVGIPFSQHYLSSGEFVELEHDLHELEHDPARFSKEYPDLFEEYIKNPKQFEENFLREFERHPEQFRQFREIKPESYTDAMTHLESILTEEKLQEWRNKLRPTEVFIYVPKFTFETSYSLSDYLKSMGMNSPFTWPGADFSGIDGTKMLYINKVLHKTYIKVDEEGTEAAGTTVYVMEFGAALPRYVVFRADHPFIFLIQERETGNILFIGKVNDPTK